MQQQSDYYTSAPVLDNLLASDWVSSTSYRQYGEG